MHFKDFFNIIYTFFFEKLFNFGAHRNEAICEENNAALQEKQEKIDLYLTDLKRKNKIIQEKEQQLKEIKRNFEEKLQAAADKENEYKKEITQLKNKDKQQNKKIQEFEVKLKKYIGKDDEFLLNYPKFKEIKTKNESYLKEINKTVTENDQIKQKIKDFEVKLTNLLKKEKLLTEENIKMSKIVDDLKKENNNLNIKRLNEKEIHLKLKTAEEKVDELIKKEEILKKKMEDYAKIKNLFKNLQNDNEVLKTQNREINDMKAQNEQYLTEIMKITLEKNDLTKGQNEMKTKMENHHQEEMTNLISHYKSLEQQYKEKIRSYELKIDQFLTKEKKNSEEKIVLLDSVAKLKTENEILKQENKNYEITQFNALNMEEIQEELRAQIAKTNLASEEKSQKLEHYQNIIYETEKMLKNLESRVQEEELHWRNKLAEKEEIQDYEHEKLIKLTEKVDAFGERLVTEQKEKLKVVADFEKTKKDMNYSIKKLTELNKHLIESLKAEQNKKTVCEICLNKELNSENLNGFIENEKISNNKKSKKKNK